MKNKSGFVPKHNEKYYTLLIYPTYSLTPLMRIVAYSWCNDWIDKRFIKSGNCFRTKRAATKAKREIEAILKKNYADQ